MKKCDVIIPIYNAYDALKECIETVIGNTNLKENRLILINDKSTDKRIIPFLNRVKDENKENNIVVILSAQGKTTDKLIAEASQIIEENTKTIEEKNENEQNNNSNNYKSNNNFKKKQKKHKN